MKYIYSSLLFGAMLALFVINACADQNSATIVKEDSESAVNTCDCYSTSSLNNIPITFDNQVPGDLNNFNQSTANCFAWQSFISLNWPVDPTKSFGEPGDYSPVQWETYMPKDVLFNATGTKPPRWGTLVSDEYATKFKSQKLLFDNKHTKLLTITKKVSGDDTLFNTSSGQAAPFDGPSWLGAQNNTNVWYEILLNKDYYDYVVDNGFYNAKNQQDSVANGFPINFPQGVYNGKTGAIELKSAWMEVPNPSDTKWKRYKLSEAVVLDTLTNKLRTTTVALVGLHILHKTQNQPTWVWSTFEQIDNVPGSSEVSNFNFYSSSCVPQQVKLKNGSTVTVSNVANTPPPYELSQAAPVPIQITRTNPIDPTDAKPINKKMQDSIKKFYPNSVWQYYQLVDVIWAENPQPESTIPIQAPKSMASSSMTSGAFAVANTTMESYIQGTTCFKCHMFSTIAPSREHTTYNNVFGDFSFVIGTAKYNSGSTKKRIKK